MTNLISREAAIDALDGICDRECEYSKKQRAVMCASCHLGSAFDAIDELPSVREYDVVAEYCKKRCFVIITVDMFEEMKRRYH